MNTPNFESFGFNTAEKLYEQRLILLENKSRVAAILGREFDAMTKKDEQHENLKDGYSSL